MPFNISDSELILLWQNGNEKAFEALYKRHVVNFTALAMSKTGNRETAEEIIQDAFLSVFLKKKTADQITNFPAYLNTMVRNRVLDHYRRDLLLKKYEVHTAKEYSDLDNSTLQLIELKELEHQLANEVEKLPSKCKKVYQLSRNQHLPNKEIAGLLSISENTVEQHMRKALRILRASILQNNHVMLIILYALFR